MAITVLKHHVPWGPFTREQIQDGLRRGDFTLQYLAHTPGLKEWLPLGEVLDFHDRHAGLPPLPLSSPAPVVEKLPPVPNVDDPPVVPVPIAPFVVSVPAVTCTRPPALPAQAVSPALGPEFRAASFPARFLAFVIDGLVLFVPLLFIFALGALTIFLRGLFDHSDQETVRQDWALLFQKFDDLLVLVATGGAWLYAAGLEASRWQATVGKQWIGLRVIDRFGARLGFFRATARYFAKYLSALPCFLGFTVALFQAQGLTWHDRIAGTRVVRR